jgi:16S rRNA (cytosine1402-N4)-methyltransferase
MLPNALQPSATDHIPVLAEEVRDLLQVQRGDTVVDATFGAGGHAELLAGDLRGDGKLIAIDRDQSARTYFERFRRRTGIQSRFLRGEFATVLGQLAQNGVKADAILLDLGISSMQVDQPERGFSYSVDAPLDMRMDQSVGQTAADVLNTYSVEDLTRILRDYGEERFAKRIADRIVAEREKEPFTTTARLSELVRDAIPAATRRTGGHPAKRTFQALRIAVNDELPVLERALPAAIAATGLGGRVAVLSYHSLEDRLVKRAFAAASESAAPPGLPVVPEQYQPKFRLLTRGAEPPTEAEIAENPRAASAKLRAAERVREG